MGQAWSASLPPEGAAMAMHANSSDIASEALFRGFSAWFAASTTQKTKQLWVECGGSLVGSPFDNAPRLLCFCDSINDFEHMGYICEAKRRNIRLFIFTTSWIYDCVARGSCFVPLGKYLLSSAAKLPASRSIQAGTRFEVNQIIEKLYQDSLKPKTRLFEFDNPFEVRSVPHSSISSTPSNRRGPTASQLADLLENEVFCLPELTIPVIREAFPTITEHLVLDTSATNEQVSQHNIVILDHERSIPEVEPTCQEPAGEPEIIEILHSKTSNRRRARVQSDSEESSEALTEEPSRPKRKTRAAADDSEQEIYVENTRSLSSLPKVDMSEFADFIPGQFGYSVEKSR